MALTPPRLPPHPTDVVVRRLEADADARGKVVPTQATTPWRGPHATPWLIEDLAEGPDRVNVRLRRREARTHRIHGHVAGTQGTPGLDAPMPFVFVESLHADPGINTKIFAIAASLFEIAMELLDVGFNPIVR